MTVLLLLGAGALLIALALQLIVPLVGRARIERRLTERGGQARVRVRAWPSILLLWRHGDRIEVRGSGIEIGMSRDSGGLGALDGFGVVDIVLTDFVTGPFDLREFELTRRGTGPYVMRAEALTTGADLVSFGTPQLGFGARAAPLLQTLARQAPLGSRPFPVSVSVELVSENGLLVVSSGTGTVGGYPAGRIATLIAAAVARRLEISF